jgi:hypothetical protein
MRTKLKALLMVGLNSAALVGAITFLLAADTAPSSFDPKEYPAKNPVFLPATQEPVGPAEAPPTAPSTAPIATAADEEDGAFSAEQRKTLSKLKDPDSAINRDAMIRAPGKPASFANDLASLAEAVKARRAAQRFNSLVDCKAATRCSGRWFLALGSQRSTTAPLWCDYHLVTHRRSLVRFATSGALAAP